MMRNGKSLLLLLAVLLTGFGFGMAHLFRLRFEAGDIYAAYSSLRSDPLGTKALYESLRSMPEISVRRHYQAMNRLREGRDTTLFYLGASARDWSNPPEELIEELEALASGGARIVIAFLPETKAPKPTRWEGAKTKTKQNPWQRDITPESKPGKPAPPSRPEKPSDDDELGGMRVRRVSLKNRWGVDLAYRELPKNPRWAIEPFWAVKKSAALLPEKISWHTAVTFSPLTNAWRVIYASDDRPVLLERPWRLGTIVLSADSYFLSNEALRAERHPDLLAWTIGPSSRVVFDEAHLGVVEEPGVVALARSYRLHGLFAALLLLAGLFIWKNSLSFIPAYEDDPGDAPGGLVKGQDSLAGFVQLLRRSISRRKILEICFSEWKKSRAHGRTDLANRVARMQAILDQEGARAARARDPVRCYQTMSRILAEKEYTHESKR